MLYFSAARSRGSYRNSEAGDLRASDQNKCPILYNFKADTRARSWPTSYRSDRAHIVAPEIRLTADCYATQRVKGRNILDYVDCYNAPHQRPQGFLARCYTPRPTSCSAAVKTPRIYIYIYIYSLTRATVSHRVDQYSLGSATRGTLFLAPPTKKTTFDFKKMGNPMGNPMVYCRYSSVPTFKAIRQNPFRTAVPFWVQITWNLSGFSPKRDCASKRFN